MRIQTTATERAGRGFALPVALATLVILYAIDLSCMLLVAQDASALTANIALPLDLMVLVPLVFWLAYIRPKRKSPIFVLPVIYLGGLASSAMSVEGSFSIVPYLLLAAFAVDALVLLVEVSRIAQMSRKLASEARSARMSPSDVIYHCAKGILGESRVTRAFAMELAMWWYLLLSWGKEPHVPEGCEAFSYHSECNATAIAGILTFLAAAEATVAHIALSRVSAVLAVAATALTVYALAWLIANTRAMSLSPILVDGNRVHLRWGFMSELIVDRANIADVVIGELDAPKGERADLSSLGGSPCWLVLEKPIAYKPLIGRTRSVRFVKISPDIPSSFAKVIRG